MFFDKARAESFPYLRKRGGHTLSKGRLLGAQMAAYLEGGLWLELAARANAAARRLCEGLVALPGRARGLADAGQRGFRRRADGAARRAGARPARCSTNGRRAACRRSARPAPDETLIRLVTSFETSDGGNRFVSRLGARRGDKMS